MGSVPDYMSVSFTTDLLPICAGCGRVRDDADRWHVLNPLPAQVDELHLTHTICPGCLARIYPRYLERKQRREEPD